MKTPNKIFKSIKPNPKFKGFMNRYTVVFKDIAIRAIKKAQNEAWNEGAIEELIKAKCLTEHLDQKERNEYFDQRIKFLKSYKHENLSVLTDKNSISANFVH